MRPSKQEMIQNIAVKLGERIERTGKLYNALKTGADSEEGRKQVTDEENHDLGLCSDALDFFAAEAGFVSQTIDTLNFNPIDFGYRFNGYNFKIFDHSDEGRAKDHELYESVIKYSERFLGIRDLDVNSSYDGSSTDRTPQTSPQRPTASKGFVLESEETKGGR